MALTLAGVAAVLVGGAGGLLGTCGPFNDVTADAFCPSVLEIFYLGITTGTTPTTYDPTSSVSRLQMAAFLSRTVDGVLKRGSRLAALDQFWTTQNAIVLGLTTVGSRPQLLKSDGADIWVANYLGNSVSRVRASDGRSLETWTGANTADGVLVAMGRVLVTGNTTPGKLYRIDPSQPAGAVTTVAINLAGSPSGLAFDGTRIWTGGSSISIITPTTTLPWTVTTVTVGFSNPVGPLYDGSNIWITDYQAATLLKLDQSGGILQTVTVGGTPVYPTFDGSNIWVPNASPSSVSVVRVSTGTVLATLTGNGLSLPWTAVFDGQRILVTNAQFGADSISLWKSADLTPLGSFQTGTQPYGACSDGVNFWISLSNAGQLARF